MVRGRRIRDSSYFAQMLEDKLLVRRLRRGDRESLRVLYEKYKTYLLSIAVSLLHETGGAEDVVHDVFVSFAGGLPNFKLRGTLRQYLTTCVVNRVRDRFRKKTFELVEIDRLGEVGEESRTPELLAMLLEESKLVAEALSQIPYEQREVIVLHLKAGMKFREIAAVQGTSTSTVQGRYRYGLDKVRSTLTGEVTG